MYSPSSLRFQFIWLQISQSNYKSTKQIDLSNLIHYICSIKLSHNMKLNRIKAVLSEKGISHTWLAKQLDKSFVW